MDLSTNSAGADPSSKTTVEEQQPPPPANAASKEDTPSIEGSKNEEPTQTREVKGASDSLVPVIKVIKSEPVTPVKSLAPPETPESDGGSFCDCDSPADSTGEAAIPQGMEQPKTSTDIAPGPTPESSTTPASTPAATPSDNVPKQAGSGSEPTPAGAQSGQATKAGPAEQLTVTGPSDQLKDTSPAQHQTETSPSGQLPVTKPKQQLPGPSSAQEVPPPVATREQTPTPATAQPTTVPRKEPTQEMHTEEPKPETCSTTAPVSTPTNDTATPVNAPEAAMAEETHTASTAEPVSNTHAAAPGQVTKAPPVSEEVPIPKPVAASATSDTAKETEPAPDPAIVTEPSPVSSVPPVTASGTAEEAKAPGPSSEPSPAPGSENTQSVSKPDPTPAPTPSEPSPVATTLPAVQSSTEAAPVVEKGPEQPSDLSSAASPAPVEQAAPASQPPKEPETDTSKASAGKPEEEAMEVDTAAQTASGEKAVTQLEPQAPCKLPTDAPPSMDDDSLSMGAHGDLRGTPKVTAEPMDMEDSLGVPVTGCSSEESSKDAPPQDFKPFSHYTEDGKLIDNEEEKSTGNKPPVTAGDVAAVALAGAGGDSMSMDDSFPGGREELSESVKSQSGSCQPTEVSQFQGQFMDFLKCNDNATQHSFGADGKLLTPSNGGEATVGSGVTANGETTTQGEVPTTPQTGKKRKRRTKAQMIADRAAAAAAAAGNNDDASNASQGDGSQKGSRSARKRKQNDDEATKDSTDGSPGKDGTIGIAATFPPEKLFEYQWPQTDKNADWFFLQEHLSAFLGVKSFKRKYPTLERRPVSMPERNFLQESGVVSEMMCDLGLTALKSDQVYELMLRDFAEKYQQYAEVLHEREQIRRSEEKNRMAADMASVTKSNVVDVVKKAVRSAAEFNAQFMRERREERKAYFDMQTCEVHYPKSTLKVLPPALTKVSAYPVALIPGQFSEYYKKYTPQQMKYFPLNTCMYDPPRHLKTIYADPADKYESELDSQSASSQGEDDGSSSSGSSSGSDGDSDSSSDVEEKETPAPTPLPTPTPASNKKSTKTPRGKKAPMKDTTIMCNICQGTSEKNKIGEAEELVKCAECGRHGHPSCLELTIEMIPNIKTYPWQCMECKTCVECMDPYDEDKMMFCDHCDRGYHTFCVGLRSIPTGRWECPSCRPEQAPPSKRRRRQPPQKLSEQSI